MRNSKLDWTSPWATWSTLSSLWVEGWTRLPLEFLFSLCDFISFTISFEWWFLFLRYMYLLLAFEDELEQLSKLSSCLRQNTVSERAGRCHLYILYIQAFTWFLRSTSYSTARFYKSFTSMHKTSSNLRFLCIGESIYQTHNADWCRMAITHYQTGSFSRLIHLLPLVTQPDMAGSRSVTLFKWPPYITIMPSWCNECFQQCQELEQTKRIQWHLFW